MSYRAVRSECGWPSIPISAINLLSPVTATPYFSTPPPYANHQNHGTPIPSYPHRWDILGNKTMKILITGSSGLIGSEVCLHFAEKGWDIHGIDNNQRAVFFGPAGDTRWNQNRLTETIKGFCHHEADIRDRGRILDIIKTVRPDAIVHTAAQPSHDRAAAIPFDDFDTNAVGTLNLLEAARQFCAESPFVHMSTNKVYGDGPNRLEMRETESRWEIADPEYQFGIPETFSIDHCKHSLFGASKAASDLLVQEYGRYFDMPTCCLRGGCLTGPNHSGVELHGFLSYLVTCALEERNYTIFGYKGKQVRDNIHSRDVASFISAFIHSPRVGEVYNIGGGKQNTCSIIEAVGIIKDLTGKTPQMGYRETPRIGDHICYYSDLRKAMAHFPDWAPQTTVQDTIAEIVEAKRNTPPSPTAPKQLKLFSVIVPARNEVECIISTVTSTHDVLRNENVPHEIVVVDDGSTDRTGEVLEQYLSSDPVLSISKPIRVVRNSGGNGIGRAIDCGLLAAQGDAVCIMMADASDSPSDAVSYWRKLNEGYDCVFGSRFMRGGKVVDYPKIKLVINRLANLFIRVLFQHGLDDTTNAFKAYRMTTIDGLRPILSPHFNITVELPLKSIVRGYSYVTIPISWANRKSGESKLKIKEMGSRYLFICLSVWLEKYFSRGDYRKADPKIGGER